MTAAPGRAGPSPPLHPPRTVGPLVVILRVGLHRDAHCVATSLRPPHPRPDRPRNRIVRCNARDPRSSRRASAGRTTDETLAKGRDGRTGFTGDGPRPESIATTRARRGAKGEPRWPESGAPSLFATAVVEAGPEQDPTRRLFRSEPLTSPQPLPSRPFNGSPRAQCPSENLGRATKPQGV